MTREDNPEYYAHVCLVIKSVFAAEKRCVYRDHIKERFNAGEITADQYVEIVADELIRPTKPEEIQ